MEKEESVDDVLVIFCARPDRGNEKVILMLWVGIGMQPFTEIISTLHCVPILKNLNKLLI